MESVGALDIQYIDSNEKNAVLRFSSTFCDYIRECNKEYNEIIIICIGTDRATGDSLGPLTGSKLGDLIDDLSYVTLYGTLDAPVHAKNISFTIDHIHSIHANPLIIAVDASLGSNCHVGYLKLGLGSLKPGAAVNKKLPSVGDFYITGIVNFSSDIMHALTLQTTKLSIVMKMADVISKGIYNGLCRL